VSDDLAESVRRHENIARLEAAANDAYIATEKVILMTHSYPRMDTAAREARGYLARVRYIIAEIKRHENRRAEGGT
jgi:hypothetical protein